METYFDNMHPREGTREKLLQDLRILLYDAEDLLKTASGNWTDKTKAELQSILQRLKATCQRLSDEANSRVKVVDQYIHDNPYPAVGVAFVAGMLLALVLPCCGKSSKSDTPE